MLEKHNKYGYNADHFYHFQITNYWEYVSVQNVECTLHPR